MATQPGFGPYDPCPCGSEKKYKFCCLGNAKSSKHGMFPKGTLAYYGPDDMTATKMVAAVLIYEYSDPIINRWVGDRVKEDPAVLAQMRKFFAQYGVKNVIATEGILGCPHEQGGRFSKRNRVPAVSILDRQTRDRYADRQRR